MKPTPASGAPADFCVIYHWQEGSVPPPYHYEYEIRVGPGPLGQVVFYPDYPGQGTPKWQEDFALSAADLDRLYGLMDRQHIFQQQWQSPLRQTVGGSLEFMDISVSSNHSRVPSQLVEKDAALVREIYDALRSLVPQALWEDLHARRQVYENEHRD